MRLKDKIVVITGGGTGIGRATALLFAKEGARVVISGRRLEPLKDTADLILKQGNNAVYFPTDVSKSNEVKHMVDETIKRFGRIDILFNNAAVFTGLGSTILDLSEQEWNELLQVNLNGVFLCSKYIIPHMIKNGGGTIINCSSISGHIGQRKQGAYNVAKGGIELLTKCMALDFADFNIRVNTVCPAWVEIDSNKEEIKLHEKEIIGMHPIGRVGQPEDVAFAVLYLASDESLWVTGTSLMVDGGYTAQ